MKACLRLADGRDFEVSLDEGHHLIKYDGLYFALVLLAIEPYDLVYQETFPERVGADTSEYVMVAP